MYICKDSVFDPVCDLCRYCIHGRMSLINLNFDTYNSLTPNWYYKVLR